MLQLSGTAGCVTLSGSGGQCATGVGIDGATGVAVSPDGRNVYVAAGSSDAIAVFDRDVETGSLVQKAGTAGCVSEDGSGGDCANGVGLDAPERIAVSSDGRNVYVASKLSGAVAVFDRDTATGALTQKAGLGACISEMGSGGDCVDGYSLQFADDVVISADGRNVYVSGDQSHAIGIFDRDPATGALTQKVAPAGCLGDHVGCVAAHHVIAPRGLAMSPDDRNVYVASQLLASIAVLDRDPSTGALSQDPGTAGCISESGGTCRDGVALDTVLDVAVSPDGRHVYAAAATSAAITVFDRDPNGDLTQKAGTDACISEDGTGGACADGQALDGVFAVTAASDGRSVYSISLDDGLAVFDRNSVTGALTQKAGTAACFSEAGGGCVQTRALSFGWGVDVSPDGETVYTAAVFSDGVGIYDRTPSAYDVDGDGESDALTDGLLVLRYRFGFSGATLITGAVDLANCTRCTAVEIEAFLAASTGP